MVMEIFQNVFINMLLGQVLNKSCFLLKVKHELIKTDESNVQMS